MLTDRFEDLLQNIKHSKLTLTKCQSWTETSRHIRYLFLKSFHFLFFLVLCYIACNSQPACQSLNFRLSDKTWQFNKETKMFFPASLKQNAGFIYADNPNRGENIFKTLGHVYQSVSVKRELPTKAMRTPSRLFVKWQLMEVP